MTRPNASLLKVLTVLALPGMIACSTRAPEVAPPTRIENISMAIAIAAVPAPFVVVSGSGPTMELSTTDEAATLFIEATEDLPGGINLVAEAEGMKDWFEQQPEGRYFGNLELGTPNGPAFTARGAYRRDGTDVEELRVFALHPSANRMLRLTYRYPPGEGKERLEQLAGILGEIEALEPDSQSASDS